MLGGQLTVLPPSASRSCRTPPCSLWVRRRWPPLSERDRPSLIGRSTYHPTGISRPLSFCLVLGWRPARPKSTVRKSTAMTSPDIPEITLRPAQNRHPNNRFGNRYFSCVPFVQKVLIFVLLRAKKYIFSIISLECVPPPKLSLLKVGSSHIYFTWKRLKMLNLCISMVYEFHD